MDQRDFFAIERHVVSVASDEPPLAKCHEWETILLLGDGQGSFRNLSGEAHIFPETGIIIHSREPWLLQLSEDAAVWEISYRWELLLDLMPPDFRNRHEGVIPADRESFYHMTGLADILAWEQRKDSPNLRNVRFLLAALLECLHSLLYPVKNIKRFFAPGRMHDFQRLQEILEAHYMEVHPVHFYAKELGISVKRLNALCHNVIGKPFGAMLEERRMTEAKNLLIGTQRAIAEIAEAVGYTDQGYFSRVFRKKYGLSPTEYRENNLALTFLSK